MRGRANIVLPALTMAPIDLPYAYLVAARGFFPAVRLLAESSAGVQRACAFLAAQTLECALKAYLSHVGFSEAELKDKKRRHNLEFLWREASDRGLSIDQQPPLWCSLLNSGHDDPYHFRYPLKIHGIVVPPLPSMVAELRKLIDAVEVAVKA